MSSPRAMRDGEGLSGPLLTAPTPRLGFRGSSISTPTSSIAGSSPMAGPGAPDAPRLL